LPGPRPAAVLDEKCGASQCQKIVRRGDLLRFARQSRTFRACLDGNIYGTNISVEILEYLTADGRSPYRDWFDELDARAAAKVAVALTRIGLGNFSNAKGVGAGVQEYRIDFGPGYRVYFGRDGEKLVILLAGGTKKRQQADIVAAQERWSDYKTRRKK
jgi:putative addiction module killer protein